MDNFSLTDLIYLIILIIIVSGGGIYYAIKKKKTYIPNRIYTMPYDDEVNAYTLQKYFAEHYPDYTCSISKGSLHIEENQSDEERFLIFTQLRDEDITAIELKDPHEVVITGGVRGAGNIVTRSSLHDLGFSQSIRDAILHFQEQAVNKRNR